MTHEAIITAALFARKLCQKIQLKLRKPYKVRGTLTIMRAVT